MVVAAHDDEPRGGAERGGGGAALASPSSPLLLVPGRFEGGGGRTKRGGGCIIALVLAYAVGVGAVSAGIQAVLAIFFAEDLGQSEGAAARLVASYICVYSLFGVAGGLLSDFRGWGAYRVQLVGCAVWFCGALGVTLCLRYLPPHSSARVGGVLTSLVVVAAGFGAQWSTVSVFVGDQVSFSSGGGGSGSGNAGNGGGKWSAATWFALYYAALNAGDLLAEGGCPALRQYGSVFDVSAVLLGLLALSIALLLAGHRGYRRPPAAPVRPVCTTIARPDVRAPLRRVAVLFAVLPVYFALFYQQSETWTFQARAMDRTFGSGGGKDRGKDGKDGAFTFPPDAMPAVNDFLVLAFLPLVAPPPGGRVARFYARLGLAPARWRPLREMALGIFANAAAFVCAAVVQVFVARGLARRAPGAGSGVGIAWQLPQYVFISLAEACVGATGLEFAYTEAPADLRSVVTSMWFLTSAVGQVLMVVASAAVEGASAHHTSSGGGGEGNEYGVGWYGTCAAVMVVLGVLFLGITRGHVYRSGAGDDDDDDRGLAAKDGGGLSILRSDDRELPDAALSPGHHIRTHPVIP